MRSYGIKRVGTRVLDDRIVIVVTHYINGRVDVDFGNNKKQFSCCEAAEGYLENDWIRNTRMVANLSDN